jgi:tetratricopeptide (TPR) repeat protein
MVTKMEKKELMEPDKLQTYFINIRAFVENYRTQIYIGTGVFVLMMLLSGGWFLYNLNYETSAGKLYNHVTDKAAKSASPNADVTLLQGYKDLITRYPKSDAAIMAYYRLANIYFSRREFDAAIGEYQEYLKRVDPKNDLITLSYSGLGACHEEKKDFNKALEYYEKAIKTNNASSFEVMNYSNIARVYEALNNSAKAIEYYRKAQLKATDPLMTIYLKRKIAILG